MATFLTVVASSYVLYFYALKSIKDDMNEYMETVGRAASSQINANKHRQFVSRDQETTPEYLEQIATMNGVKKLFHDIKYVYTCILKDGEVYFILDPTPPGIIEGGVETKSHIMDKYEEAQHIPALMEALKTQKTTFVGVPYTDRWGRFVSAYTPLIDDKGEFVGVVAVDLEADKYAAKLSRIRNAELMCILIGLLISVFFGYVHYWQAVRKKNIGDHLAQSEQRFHLAVTGSNNGIWDYDLVTDTLYLSPRFKELMGYADDEMPNRFEAWSERLHPEDKERVLELMQIHLTVRTVPYDIEYRLKTKSGEYRWYRAKGQAVWNDQDKPVRMAGSLSDISRRKAIEAELIVAKEEAQKAALQKAEFLANMSHEIRTPMNGIIGMTNLLLESNLGAVERGYAETVINSAEALLQIINDILDFSKIEAGKIDLEAIPFDLQLLCEEVCEMMAFKAKEKKIELLLHYLPGTPNHVIGDPGRVRQILFNLINNAIKFTDSGHVLITLRATPENDGRHRFHVEVEDTGIGIPADKVDIIFNKFTQADQSTARKFGGTGLGLSICKELTRMMEGEVGARSSYGVGSTFWFDMLLAPDTTAVSRTILPQASQLQGVRLLMVDDNTAARAIVREQMMPCGVQVVEVGSAEKALEVLKSDAAFDAAVVDFIMPGMDGMALGKAIKDNPRTCSIALLLLTAVPSRGDKQRAEAIGFAGYLSKPFMPWQVRDALAVIVEAKKTGRTIPIVTRHSLKEAKAGAQQKDTRNVRFSGTHILLVEDNPVNQKVATTMIEQYGCTVMTANDGQEAVQKAKKHRFDLIFMDCQMPVMDGYEATGILRTLEAHQQRPRAPIVAFTANALKEDDKKCYEAGMDDYITKPVRRVDLERVLVQWLPARTTTDPNEAPRDDVSVAPDAVLDQESFRGFAELMGEEMAPILTRHLEVSQGYVAAIHEAASKGDYKAMAMAAHPLKSSNQQIGAMKLAAIAKALEQLGNEAAPDATAVAQNLALLDAAYTEMRAAVEQKI